MNSLLKFFLLFSLLTLPAWSAEKNVIDIHTHIVCLKQEGNDCFVNPRLLKNIRYRYYLKAFGVTKKDIQQGLANKKAIKRLVDLVSESRRLQKVVVLALDGAIKADGELDRKHSELYIPNEYVLQETSRHPELLYGASINPDRPDALERLDQAYLDGAVLIKWLPNIMQINPANRKYIPFYQSLVKYNLPLLTHTGFEHSFSSSNDTLGDPRLLELPLSLGVRVIAAHFGTGGSNDKESNFNRILPLFKKYPNLYGDLSGLTLPTKFGAIKKIMKHKQLEGRILYGSDYPLVNFPVTSPYYYIFRLSPKKDHDSS